MEFCVVLSVETLKLFLLNFNFMLVIHIKIIVVVVVITIKLFAYNVLQKVMFV